MTLAQILKTLPTLSQADLQQVQQRLMLLLKTDVTAPINDWLLDGFTIELRRRGLWTSRSAIPRKLLPADYESNADGARSFLISGVKGPLRDDAKRVLASVGCAELIRWLAKFTPSVTLNTVFTNLHNLGPALDDSFPGYWQSAALSSLLGMGLAK